MLKQEHLSIYQNLIKIYGINKKKATFICQNLGIGSETKVIDLTTHKKDNLNAMIISLKKNNPGIDAELKQTISTNIKRLININSYRGKRHKLNLPTRGQRTRSNHQTAKRITHH